MVPIHLLCLQNMPILQQLQLEEALLRADNRNWCLVNVGSPPAVVLGISGKTDQLLNITLLKEKPIPLIRRFSGGGTVVVDRNTCFITLICNKQALDIPCFPDKVMKWTESLYKLVFPQFDFRLVENDYVIGNRKFGGNAQYMRKDRWLHHTSLLWDYDEANMMYLQLPQKAPNYRMKRDHSDFLCKLREHFPSTLELIDQFKAALKLKFDVDGSIPQNELQRILSLPHRKATSVVVHE